MNKRRAGDTFSFDHEKRKINLQYLGNHPDFGQVVFLWSPDHDIRPKLDSGICIFYPLELNLREGNLGIVGHEALRMQMPDCFIRRIDFGPGRNAEWIIDEGGQERRTKSLTEREKAFVPVTIWSHAILCGWLEGGWDYSQP